MSALSTMTAGPCGPYSTRRLGASDIDLVPPSVRGMIKSTTNTRTEGSETFGAFDADGGFVAAASLVPQAGRTGMLFTATAGKPSPPTAAARAIEACCRSVSPKTAVLVQSLLDPRDQTGIEALRTAGFWRLSELNYMWLDPIPRRCIRPAMPYGVTIRTFDDGCEDLLTRALEASYEGSADCPLLRGLRQPNDVIAGHRATGVFDPRLWSIAMLEGAPVAVMLLNPVPHMRGMELVYLGVANACRRRSLASTLIRYGLWQSAKRGAKRLTLAVDAANSPAVALYRRMGFRITDHRTVMLRQISPRHTDTPRSSDIAAIL